jgi:hypothetical protein
MKMVVIALLAIAPFIAVAQAQDEAEYTRWNLDITYGSPDYVLMKDAMGHVQLCWYLTYTVTNNTDAEVPLGLRIKADTDTGMKYRDSIAPRAQKALKKKTGKTYKNALDMTRGNIGAGQKIEAVAFFGELDANWDVLNIRIAGLYETVDQVDGKLFFEKKVLVLTWSRPGDEFGSADDPITFKSKTWVIEGERVEIPQNPVD